MKGCTVKGRCNVVKVSNVENKIKENKIYIEQYLTKKEQEMQKKYKRNQQKNAKEERKLL